MASVWYSAGIPTGKMRVRTQRRFLRADVLVLQVEVDGEVHSYPNDFRKTTWWRDARTEDLTKLNLG